MTIASNKVSKLNLTKSSFLFLSIYIVVFTPQLNPVFDRGEMHINLVYLSLSLISLIFFRSKLSNGILVGFIYLVTLQFLLVASYVLNFESTAVGLSDLPSFIRPLFFIIVFLGLINLLTDLKLFYHKAVNFFGILSVFVFAYSVFEVFFFDYFGYVINLLYRMEDKSNIDSVAVSFFSLPYNQAYVLSIMLPFLLSGMHLKKTFQSRFFVFSCISAIILTQSKMGVVVAFLIIFIFYFLSFSRLNKIFILLFFSILVSLLAYFIIDILRYLDSQIGGNFTRTSLLIFTNFEYAYNLTERLRQIGISYDALMNLSVSPFVGYGLAKGLTLESWISYYMYRYGFLGLIFFVFFFLFSAFSLYKKSRLFKSVEYVELSKISIIWLSFIFLTQLSGPMLEFSKSAFFSILMLAIVSILLVKKAGS